MIVKNRVGISIVGVAAAAMVCSVPQASAATVDGAPAFTSSTASSNQIYNSDKQVPALIRSGSVSRSGHKVCPRGQQVRVWSFVGSQGGTVSHSWYSDYGPTHDTDSWSLPSWGFQDNQTFTLQRDVYWTVRAVSASGRTPTISAGAACV